jgi:hypothetical protein
MVRIINAFRGESPIGNVLTQLGQQLFGDQAGASITREQAYALQRGNAETDNLMARTAAGGGAQLNAADPITQAMMIGAGYDPSDYANMALMGAANQFGFDNPRTTNAQLGAGIAAGSTATGFNRTLAETARNNNLQSGDRRYGVDVGAATTLTANDADNAAALARQNALPYSFVGPDGVPIIGTQSTAVGERPIISNTDVQGTLAQNAIMGEGIGALDEPTQAYLGINAASTRPGTSWNYITPSGQVFITNDTAYAAGTDAQGRPLPPDGTRGELQATDMGGLAPAAKSDLDKMEFALYRLDNTATQLLGAIDAADPRSFGLAGAVADLGRGAVTAVANLAGLLGVEEFSATALRQRLATAPQDPNDPVQPGTWDLLFNPAATELQTLGGIFLWQAAAALAGQGGRELSNADMTRVIEQFGSPTSWGTDQVRYREKIVSLQNYARDQLALIQTYRANQGAPPQGAAAPPAPTTTTGTLTPNPDGTLTWTP